MQDKLVEEEIVINEQSQYRDRGEHQVKEPMSTSALLGREMFQHAFMAVDYLEFKFSDVKSRLYRNKELSVENSISTSRSKNLKASRNSQRTAQGMTFREQLLSERGDVPGWVLVVLMTTGLVTAIWAVAAPKLNAILKNSLDSMNNIR